MVQPQISEELAEQLLSGVHHDGTQPSSLGELGAVFHVVRSPADPSELAGLDDVKSMFTIAVAAAPAGTSTARTHPMFKKLLTGKAIATIGALTLVSAGAAAAATGTLPSPFASERAQVVTQEHVPDVAFDAVGKHADTDDTTADTTGDTTADTTGDAAADRGPDVTGPAQFGLCTAAAAHAKHADDPADTTVATDVTESTELSLPFQKLADAAAAAGQTVEQFCEGVTPGRSADAPGQADDGAAGTDKHADNPSATAPGQADENPSATAPGHVDETPSATAPAQPEENPSATAPGQDDASPSDTAPGASGNRGHTKDDTTP